MTTETESLLIMPISVRQFELYALSLERGPNFETATVFAAYQVGRGSACGGIFLDQETGAFSTVAMRRRVDHCWACVARNGPFSTPEQALDALSIDMRGGDAPEPLSPGEGYEQRWLPARRRLPTGGLALLRDSQLPAKFRRK